MLVCSMDFFSLLTFELFFLTNYLAWQCFVKLVQVRLSLASCVTALSNERPLKGRHKYCPAEKCPCYA